MSCARGRDRLLKLLPEFRANLEPGPAREKVADLSRLILATHDSGDYLPEMIGSVRLFVGDGLQHIETRCPPGGEDGEHDTEQSGGEDPEGQRSDGDHECSEPLVS